MKERLRQRGFLAADEGAESADFEELDEDIAEEGED